MKKILPLLLILSIASCSRSQLEKSGWLPPTYQKSKSIEVSGAAFAIDNSTAEIKYYLDLKILNKGSEWVIVNFEDPQNRENFLKKIYSIQPEQTSIKLTSDAVYGARNFQSYEAKILLSKDKDGNEIKDSISQYVRAYRIPQKLVNYNMIPTTGKRFWVSGQRDDKVCKSMRCSSEMSKFLPDEVKSKNFTLANSGFWVYYDIPRADQYTTNYNGSNLTVRYEYTLNRKKGFTDKVYQRAVLENPEDQNKPFTYESVLDSSNKASKVFHGPLKNIVMGKKYKLTFEFYSDEKRTKLLEKVTQEIRSTIDNTKGCIKIMPELIYFTPEPSKWMCKL